MWKIFGAILDPATGFLCQQQRIDQYDGAMYKGVEIVVHCTGS